MKNTKKQNTKATRTKATKAQATKTATAQPRNADAFKIAVRESNGNTAQALRLTRTQRKAYAQQIFTADNMRALSDIAERLGESTGRAFNITASFPIKSDIAKLQKITAFEKNGRNTLSPRQIVALVVAYILRDNADGFGRVFPCGLFIENGCLRDMITAGFLTADDNADATAQRFIFTDRIKKLLFSDKSVLSLESRLADADLI